MRRLLAAVVVWWALAGSAGPARAQPPSAEPPAKTAPAFGDGQQSKRAPIQAPKDRPAKGAPYNWTQMAFAAVIMLVMLGGVVFLVRRSTRHRRSGG